MDTTTENKKIPAPSTSNPTYVLDPTQFEAKTPIVVNPGPASAIPVLAVYRPSVNGKRAIEIYFACIGLNGCEFTDLGLPKRCAVIRGTWWLSGTKNDQKSRQAFFAVLNAMGYTAGLTSFEQNVVDAWCAEMVAEWRPVTLVLEPDGDRYQRIRYVNKLLKPLSDEYKKALADTGLLVAALTQAKETADKIAGSGSGGQEFEQASDIPF